MLEIIVAEFDKIIKKFILKYAAENKVDVTNVQILFSLQPGKQEGVFKNRYSVTNGFDFKGQKELSILDLLCVRLFHARGYQIVVPPYILKALEQLSEQENIPKQDISVMILQVKNVDLADEIKLFLFNGKKKARELTIEELFADG